MTEETENGLVSALLLDGEGGGRALDWAGVREWQPEAGTLWVHLDRNHPGSRRWLEEEAGVGVLVSDALLAEETRPRAQSLDGGWVILMRGVNLNPGADPEDMVSIRMWTDGRRVLSTRMRWVSAVAQARESLLGGNGPKDAGGVIETVAYNLVVNMQDYRTDLAERLDGLEEEVLTHESRTLRTDLAEFRRQSVMLRRYLAPQRDALVRMQGAQVPWLSAEDKAALLETVDDLTRYVEDLDAMKDRAGILQETLSHRISERMEHRMYQLGMIATIFLPLSFVTGLLGINVAGIPGAEFHWAFWVVVGMLAVVSGLLLWFFHRHKWF